MSTFAKTLARLVAEVLALAPEVRAAIAAALAACIQPAAAPTRPAGFKMLSTQDRWDVDLPVLLAALPPAMAATLKGAAIAEAAVHQGADAWLHEQLPVALRVYFGRLAPPTPRLVPP